MATRRRQYKMSAPARMSHVYRLQLYFVADLLERLLCATQHLWRAVREGVGYLAIWGIGARALPSMVRMEPLRRTASMHSSIGTLAKCSMQKTCDSSRGF